MAKMSKISNVNISMAYRETIACFHTFAYTFAIHHDYGCVLYMTCYVMFSACCAFYAQLHARTHTYAGLLSFVRQIE